MDLARIRAFDVGCGIAFIVAALMLAQSDLSFAWKLILAVAMIVGSGALARQRTFSWPETVRLTGWLALIIIVLNSGIGSLVTKAIDSAEGSASEWAGSEESLLSGGCPPDDYVPVVQLGQIFRLKAGCTHTYDVRELPRDESGRPAWGYDGVGPEFATRYIRELISEEYTDNDRTLKLTPKEEVFKYEGREPVIDIAFNRLGERISADAIARHEAKFAPQPECPETVQTINIGSVIVVPVNCNVDTDVFMIRDGNFELDFADSTLPVSNGARLLNGKRIQEYVTTSYHYEGREGHGMRFTTVDPTAFKLAGVKAVKIEVLRKGAVARQESQAASAASAAVNELVGLN
ncbi:hypothetical protein [Tsuneonella sp. HG222]